MSESPKKPGPLDRPPRRPRRAKAETTVHPNGAAATTNAGGESAAVYGGGEAAPPAATIKEALAIAEEAGAEVQDGQAETVMFGPGSGDATKSDDVVTTDAPTVAVDQAKVAADDPRFRIFIIDTGWNAMAQKVLQAHLALFRGLMGGNPVYALGGDMSLALLRRNRDLIGRDPIIYVHDLHALRHGRTSGVHGLRLHLGLLRDEDRVKRALTILVEFLARFQMSEDFEFQVRRRLHLAGLVGAIAIIGGKSPHNLLYTA
jgi:hypothetical protein